MYETYSNGHTSCEDAAQSEDGARSGGTAQSEDAAQSFVTVTVLPVTVLPPPCPRKILTKQEKFKKAMLVCQNICSILSDYGTDNFQRAYDELIQMKAKHLKNEFGIRNVTRRTAVPQGQVPVPTGQAGSHDVTRIKLGSIKLERIKLKRTGRPKVPTQQW